MYNTGLSKLGSEVIRFMTTPSEKPFQNVFASSPYKIFKGNVLFENDTLNPCR